MKQRSKGKEMRDSRIALVLTVAASMTVSYEAALAHPHHSHHHHDHSQTEQSKDKLQIAYRTPTALPANKVEISVSGSYRYIKTNCIPDHATGTFPNAGNPNSIKAQDVTFKMPVKPKALNQKGQRFPGIFGVAVNGVPLDPNTGETWDGNPMSKSWRYEALTGHINLGCDQNNAHVQPDGTYHYHGIPTALLERLTEGKPKMVLMGFAADGFPFYGPYGYIDPKSPKKGLKKITTGYRLKSGTRPDGPGGKYDGTFLQDFEWVQGKGDLDDCNGRFGVTPEFPEGTYHYYLTYDYPFIPRLFKGTPDDSFKHRSLPPSRPGGGAPGAGGFPPGGPGAFPPPHPGGFAPMRPGGNPGTGGFPPMRPGGVPGAGGFPPPPGGQFRRLPPGQGNSIQNQKNTNSPVNRNDHIKQYNW